MWANRNGNFYVLDRATGKFLSGKPFVKVNWMDDLRRARPAAPDAAAAGRADVAGQPGRDELVLAVVQSAHRPLLRLRVGRLRDASSAARRSSIRKDATSAAASTGHSCRFPARRRLPGSDAARSTTGPKRRPRRGPRARRGHRRAKWKFPMTDVTDSGILTTASDVLFTGGREGYFQALDARTGIAAVEGEPRRADRQRADHLRGRRQTVRHRDLRPVAVRLRTP